MEADAVAAVDEDESSARVSRSSAAAEAADDGSAAIMAASRRWVGFGPGVEWDLTQGKAAKKRSVDGRKEGGGAEAGGGVACPRRGYA